MRELGRNDGGGADDVRIAVTGEIVRLLERGHRDSARWAAGGALRHLGRFRGLEMGTQPDPERLLAMICSPGYSAPDQWQVQIQAQIQTKASVLVKTSGLGPDDLRKAHFVPIEDVSAAVERALQNAGAWATLCALPQGPQTIPYVE